MAIEVGNDEMDRGVFRRVMFGSTLPSRFASFLHSKPQLPAFV